MKKVISLMLSLVMMLSIFAVSAQSYAAEFVDDSEVQSMFSLVNNLRTGSDAWCWNEDNKTKTTFTNLKAYQYDVNLEKIAQIRAKELEESFSHTRPNGQICFDCTVNDANGNVVKTFGENIAAGTNMNSELAFNIWLEADQMYAGQGHRRNMLSDKFTCIGIAAFKSDDGKTYWVQEFGKADTNTDTDVNLELTAVDDGVYVEFYRQNNGQFDGYQIQFSTDSRFKNANNLSITDDGNDVTRVTISELNECTVYYFRIRSYYESNGTTIYSKWSDTETIRTNGHSYTEVVTKQPTCKEKGIKTFTCEFCGDTYTELIDFVEHDWTDWQIVNAPLNCKDGLSIRICNTCNEIDKLIIPSAGTHTSDNGTVTKAATYTASGVKTYKCTVCGDVIKTETIPKLLKKANTLKVKTKKPTVKFAKLKKKNQTIALKKAMLISGAKGLLSFDKISGNKKITINKKTGKITVKKGLKKGTYKVKFRVTAAGNSEYNSESTSVIIKIKVK